MKDKQQLQDDWITQSFRLSEFKCPCCGTALDGPQFRKFISTLQEARNAAGVPFVINSGYRCLKHNKKVGGVKDSAHTKGLAVDIKVTDNVTRYKILQGLLFCGFTRIGLARGFIHVDVDDTKPQEVCWFYDG